MISPVGKKSSRLHFCEDQLSSSRLLLSVSDLGGELGDGGMGHSHKYWNLKPLVFTTRASLYYAGSIEHTAATTAATAATFRNVGS